MKLDEFSERNSKCFGGSEVDLQGLEADPVTELDH